MLLRITFLLSLCFLFAQNALGQNAASDFKTTDYGVEYKVIEDKNGTPAELGGALMLDLKFFNEKDTFSSAEIYKQAVSVPLPEPLSFQHSIEAVLAKMSAGDSVHIKMRNDSLYVNVFQQNLPGELRGQDKTTFEVRIVEVISKDSINKMITAYAAEQQAAAMAKIEQAKKDSVSIAQYLKKNKIKAKRTSDGVYYTITKKAKGLPLKSGDNINTFYAGRLLSGEAFDSNVGKEPFPLVVAESPIIPGWHSALANMKKGEKATVYIPSALAYGENGAGASIPPNSILVFDIEVLK